MINDNRKPKILHRPNIHKTENLERPVVSSVNCHTNTISKYAYFQLQPIVKNTPSYVRDTTDFLKRLHKVKKNSKRLLTCNS